MKKHIDPHCQSLWCKKIFWWPNESPKTFIHFQVNLGSFPRLLSHVMFCGQKDVTTVIRFFAHIPSEEWVSGIQKCLSTFFHVLVASSEFLNGAYSLINLSFKKPRGVSQFLLDICNCTIPEFSVLKHLSTNSFWVVCHKIWFIWVPTLVVNHNYLCLDASVLYIIHLMNFLEIMWFICIAQNVDLHSIFFCLEIFTMTFLSISRKILYFSASFLFWQ